MSSKYKVFIRATTFGALLGGLLATWIAPRAIAWYFDPPIQMGFTCKEPIEWALHRLQMAQLGGIVVGGLAALFLYFTLRKSRATKEL